MKEIKFEDIKLPDRSLVTNKGDAGRILVIGGDRGMAGAVAFSAESAYRSGAGLVEICSHKDNRVVLQTLIPEAIFSDWESLDLKKADAIVLGVGMGKSVAASRIVERVLTESRVPTVVDADALNLMAENPDLLTLLSPKNVVTPHVAELSRLMSLDVSYVKNNLEKAATDFASEYNTNIIAKSNVSYVALYNGELYRNTTGNSSLSTGGSGDVLTGIISAFLAGGLPIEEAVPYSAFLHGKAGERAGERLGERSVMARDIIDAITSILRVF
ncbi:MAG: NAD(P)H-hydrate dehydratase [Clostridia bacterium]|nr:NAD(P)H-hydrate dehydratase [Clostridia bacterium]